MNIIVSAMVKTGSTVIVRTLAHLSNAEFITGLINIFFKSLMEEISKETNFIVEYSGGLDIIRQDGVYLRFHLINKTTFSIEKSFNFYVKNEFIEIFAKTRENIILRTHASPKDVINNWHFKTYKKIFVMRNIFDVINSHMKFIDNSKEAFHIMEKYRNKDILASYRYKQINRVMQLIVEWKKQVNEYIQYKDDFILIKYEDFIKEPINTIMSIDKKLEKKKIENAIRKYLYKELGKNHNIHKYYQHYNPGRKIGDFNRFFTDEMIDFVYSLTKNELEALGYDINELVDKSIEKYERIDEIEKAYKDLTQGCKLIEKSSSIAILGAARAASIAFENLHKKFNVICFIDDFKRGELFSIPIVSREEFGKEFSEKVDFIVKGPHQKGFDIDELYDKKIIPYEKCKFYIELNS